MGRLVRWLSLAAILVVPDSSAAPPTLDFQLVANLLTNVIYVTHAGDGSCRLFIVQQNGLIKIFNGTNVLSTPYLNISSLLTSGGEEGLLGLAFHPGYATNGNFYVYCTHPSHDSNIVARFTASPPSNNVVKNPPPHKDNRTTPPTPPNKQKNNH